MLVPGTTLYLTSSEDSYLTPVRSCEFIARSLISGGGIFRFPVALNYPKDTTILPIDVTFIEAVLYPVQDETSVLDFDGSIDVFVGVDVDDKNVGQNGFVRLSRGTLFRKIKGAQAFSEKFS